MKLATLLRVPFKCKSAKVTDDDDYDDDDDDDVRGTDEY
jgi:hypothetical protein